VSRGLVGQFLFCFSLFPLFSGALPPDILPPAATVSPTRRFTERGLSPEYDVIVVGTGPAGCSLVARLAQKKLPSGEAPSILMLEAGLDQRDHDDARIPAQWWNVAAGEGQHMHQ
jgi:hypothetical protein